VNRLLQHARIDVVDVIQPAPVESRVSGIIDGVKVAGYVDLLDSEGRLIDSKTAIKPIRGIAHDHRVSTHQLRDDHVGRQRRLPVGYGDEGKDLGPDSKEFLRQ
jgi:hypothetical protein